MSGDNQSGFTYVKKQGMTTDRPRKATKATMGNLPSTRTRLPAWKAKAGGIVATVVQLAAVFSVLLLFTNGTHGRLLAGIDMVFSSLSVPTSASVVMVLLLVVLGAALRRRKKAALYTLVLFQVAGLMLHARPAGDAAVVARAALARREAGPAHPGPAVDPHRGRRAFGRADRLPARAAPGVSRPGSRRAPGATA